MTGLQTVDEFYIVEGSMNGIEYNIHKISTEYVKLYLISNFVFCVDIRNVFAFISSP